jgi:hypothetical protein
VPLFQGAHAYLGPVYGATQGPILIGMDDDKSIATMLCFGAFANKSNGIVYHALMGNLFILLDGSVCFFVLYHYESNAILVTPTTGLDDKTIFDMYKKYFDKLTNKGFKPKLNIIDNQATTSNNS